MTAHWGIEDPAAVEGTAIQKEAAFVLAERYLRNRIMIFINLPIRSLDRMALNAKLREFGRLEGASKPRPEVALWMSSSITIRHAGRRATRSR